jgi:hypothetical protein
MTRFIYGGGGDGDIIKPTGVPYINATANVYDARTGGSQITDLQNMSGAGITIVTTDAFGQAIFYGPDNYIGTLWLDFGSGVRWGLSPKAVDLAAARSIAVQRASDAATPSYTQKAHLPYNANDPLEQALATALDPQVLPRFSSATARDAAFPSPQEGDRCYRTDIRIEQVYNASLASWCAASYAWALGASGGGSVVVSNTTTETQLSGATVPPNPVAGATFRVTAYGITQQAANTTPTINFRLRVGGVTGSALATTTFTAASDSSPSNRSWQVQGHVTLVSVGPLANWFGNLTGHSLITSTSVLNSTGASVRSDGSALITRTTVSSQVLSLSVQWDTASSSNTCTMYGCFWERVN